MNKRIPLFVAGLAVAALLPFGLFACVDDGPFPSPALGPTPSTTVTVPHPAMPARIAVLGDSISDGFGATRGYPEIMAEQLDARVVADFAVGGATARTMLDGQFTPGTLATARPDLVIVALGVNDYLGVTPPATYERNLGALLDRVCRTAPAAPVLLVHLYALDGDALARAHPELLPPGPRAPWGAYGAAMARVADRAGTGYLNLGDAAVHLGSDGAHADDVGQAQLADLVIAGISQASECGR